MSKNQDKKAVVKTEIKETEVKVCTVANIAKAHEMDPKVARAKMRRLYRGPKADTTNLPRPIKEGSWTFDAKDEAAIEALLLTPAKA